MAGSASLWAGPTGEQVVAGQAMVSRSGANTLITQSTDRAAINWSSFNIGANESVRFAQPSASSIALNRVLGQNPTEILGALSANGQIFLLNPNGVLFGRGAQVNVGGLVASTLNLSDSDFMAGRYRFVKDGTAGEVRNAGEIIATGGYVALIGPQVKNEGVITAASGNVALAAGDQVTLNLNGNKLIGITVDQGTLNALADNKGLIRADGGQVLLTAKAADQLIKSVVNNDGIIEAASLSNINGVIRLEGDVITSGGTLRAGGGATQSGGSITLAAANDITLASNSVISVSGVRGGDITVQAQGGTLLAEGRIEAIGNDSNGGAVKLLGNQVGLINTASVDASGKTGGGTVLVGGDYQGLNADVQNARAVVVGPDARITADATGHGDGGKVILWSNEYMGFYGGISARGGGQGGNGGFVETSSHDNLQAMGSVDASASAGKSGTWLLDPADVNITNATANGTFGGGSPNVFTPNSAAATANANAATINASLNAGTSVTINTVNTGTAGAGAGNITVSSAISKTAGAAATLTLNAANNIVINSAITSTTGALNLTLNGVGITTAANISLLGGALTLNNSGTGFQTAGVIQGTTSLVKNGAGTYTLTGANTYTGATTINAGVLSAGTLANGGANSSIGASTNAAGNLVLGGGTLQYTGATATTNRNFTLTAGTTSTIDVTNAANTLTISGASANTTGSITKTGPGTLTLSGANTHTGATNINAGTLALGAANRIANASAVKVASGATFNLAGFAETVGSIAGGGNITLGAGTLNVGGDNTSTVFSGAISGTGGLAKAGTGTLTLSGVNTYTGNTSLTAGTLRVAGGNAIADTSVVVLTNAVGVTLDLTNNETIGILSGGGVTGGNITLNANTLTVNETGASTYSGVISGTGGLTKIGASVLTLGGVNTYTGATTISVGTLTLNATGSIAASSGVANDGIFTIAAAKTIDSMTGVGATNLGANILTIGDASNTSSTYTGVVSGTGGLTTAGTGTLTLGGVNAYTGATTIGAGSTLALDATGTIATSSGVANAGTLTVAANKTIDSMTGAGATTLGANTLTIGDASNTSSAYTGVISGVGGLTKAGTGTLTLGGVNAYTGATTISAGTLALNATGDIAASSGVANAGTLTIAANKTIDSMTGAGATTLGANTLTIGDASNTSSAYTGVISGTGGLIKDGAGTLTLGGVNTYTGATTISAGTLALDATGTIAASSGVANAGNFTIAANKTIDSMSGAGATTLGGTLTIGDASNTSSTYTGVMSGAGGLTKAGTGTLTLGGTNTYAGTTTVSAGTLAITNASALGSTAAGTTVTAGATLALQGGITVGAEALSITGTGAGTNGALRNLSGNNTWGGTVTLTGASEIQSDVGTLTLGAANAVTAANQNLTVDGAGNTTVSGIIATGTGALTKTGAGTLTLSGANTYTGTTTVSAGSLVLQGGSAIADTGAVNLGTAGANLTLNNNETMGSLAGVAGTTVTLGANTLTTGNAANTTYAGVISGTGSLTKQGTGALTLSGANTYTGTTTINTGTLTLGASNVLADASSVVVNGGTFDVNTRVDTVAGVQLLSGSITSTTGILTATSDYDLRSGTVSARLSGAVGLNKSTAGTVTLSGTNTYTGATSVQQGVLLLANATALGTTAGATTVNTGAAVQVQGGIAVAEAITLNGTGVAGDGALRNVSGNNTWTGAVTLGAGGTRINSDAGTIIFSGAGAISGAGQPLSVGGAGATTIGKVISNTDTLTKDGAGTLILSGANTYTGATTVNAGTLQLGANNVLPDTTNVAVNGGATLSVNSRTDTVAGVQLTAGAITGTTGILTSTSNYDLQSGAVSAILAGGVGLNKSTAGSVTLSGVNTYTGATTISAGTLALDATGTIAASSGVANAGNFTIAANKTIDSMSGAGATTLGGTLTIGDASNTSSTYTGVMSGAGGLTKAGTGTLTLGGTNTYAGTTTVSAGTLAITNVSALGSTAAGTTVTAGATLNVNNVALAAEAIALNGAGVGGAGALTGTGAASLAGTVNLASASTVGTTSAASSLTLNGVVSAPSVLTIRGAGAVTATHAGNDFSAVTVTNAGNVSLRDANNITLNASTLTGGLAVQSSGTLTVGGVISANGAGDAIVLSGGRFVNTAGAGALTTSAPGARWLVWSANPNPFGGGSPDNRGGLAYNFKQYNAVFGDPVLGAGNGFLYTLAPSITPGLTGTVTRVYDGSTTATLAAGNFTATGAVDGDAITLSGTGTYDTRNAGTLKTVTATGITASAANGAATVYGYAVLPATANAAIGEITAAPLTVTAQTDNRVYNGTTVSAAAPVVTGTLYDVVGTAATQSYDTRHVGINKTLTASGLVVNDGNGGNNYAVTYVNDTTGVITAAPLTVTAQTDNRAYNGTTGSVAAPVVGALFVGDAVGTAPTQVYDTRHAGTNKTLTASGLVVNDGNSGNNYAVTYVASNTGVITAAPLSVTAQTDNRVYDGTASSAVAPIVGALFAGDIIGTVPTQVYDTQNAGTNKTLSASGLVVNDGNGGNNYAITYVSDTTGVITARGITVAANNAAKIYGNMDPAFTFTVGGLGLVGGDTITSVFSGALVRAAGENVAGSPYAINQGTLATNANYSVAAYTPGQFTITPRALTISADNASKAISAPLPPFTASYAGFAFADNPASLAGALVFNTPATAGSPAGTYVITPSGQTSTNYAISYVNGTLTVNAAGAGGTPTGIPAGVLAAITSGSDQLPPPNVSGPPTVSTTFASVQPNNVTESGASTPSAGTISTGAVINLVNIINGGVNLPAGLTQQ